ncbi:bifunctional folylpolyglutamate synthase/dihydrofolate synthase [Spirochaetota bacterium]
MNKPYKKAFLDGIYAYTNFEKRRFAKYVPKNYNLSGIRQLLSHLGDPHKKLKLIHIAGTKGKGSTAFFLFSILRNNNCSVGIYTSPHLIDERERIRVNDTFISWKELYHSFEKIEAIIKKFSITTTFFDIMTAICFNYFKSKNIDYGVIETGLGGRLDSTNVLSPIACIISSISYDHMDKLGYTIEAIASEKAGIIKKNTPVFTGNTGSAALRIIKEKCKAMHAPLYTILPGTQRAYWMTFSRVLPAYQEMNLLLASACARGLQFTIDREKLYKSVKNGFISGRFQKIHNFILDAAHNKDSFEKLAHSLRHIKKKYFIVFFLPDKDIEACIQAIPKESGICYFPVRSSYITFNRNEIFTRITSVRQDAVMVSNYSTFMRSIYNKKTSFIVCGSFYIVSYFLKILKRL